MRREQALEALRSEDLIGVGMEADAVRRRLHPDNTASYTVTATICTTGALTGEGPENLFAEVEEALDQGATDLMLRARLGEKEIALEQVEELLRALGRLSPAVGLHGLSARGVKTLARRAGAAMDEVFARLRDAGLRSLSGHDAGILDDEVQMPGARLPAEEWLAVHRAAHRAGVPSSATMTFGMGETIEHRLRHLEAVAALQQETGGFVAFVPRPFAPLQAGLSGFEEATAVEYLRTLAVSRILLESIPHVEADWQTQGLKVLQMAMRFGADDAGSALPGGAVTAGAGDTTEEDLRRILRGAGLRPVQRDPVYRMCFLN